MKTVRVRIAPSPTGDGAHVGLARTALFNGLYARHHGGAFILRSEDTDVERSKPEYEEAIRRDFSWLGLHFDEFHRQSERVGRHTQVARQLRESGAAYPCYCSSEELKEQQERATQQKRNTVYEGRCRLLAERLAQGGEAAQAAQRQIETWQAQGRKPMLRFKIQDYAWDEAQNAWVSLPMPAYRAQLEEHGAIVVHDLIKGQAAYELLNPALDKHKGAVISDLVILRADGRPTYNFAVVVDDVDMGITHVIRGDEHLNNTPKQMLIYAALGAPLPHFAHLPMILDKDKKKLSKRRSQVDVFVNSYRQKGVLPEALINFLARLGWSKGDQEIFSLEQLVDAFSLEAVGHSPAVFDDEKLLWLNQHYLKTGDPQRLATLLRAQLLQDGILTEQDAEALSPHELEAAIELLKERVHTLGELAEASRYLFREDFCYDARGVEKFINAETLNLLELFSSSLSGFDGFSPHALEASTQDFLERHESKLKHLAQPVRLALTGRTKGAGLFELISFFGRDGAVRRLERAVQTWEQSP